MILRPLSFLSVSVVLAAADPASTAMEHLRAANALRAEYAREHAAWTSERQRLEALIAATQAEAARLTREAEVADQARAAAATRLAALGQGSDLDTLRTQLADTGERLSAALTALARTMPPGAVPVVAEAAGEAAFDAAVRALDGAERAAAGIAVEVVTGTRDGRSEAVKMLRVAGAAAWWVALDGSAAGRVTMRNGVVGLEPADEAGRAAILAALAQAEGRATPGVTLLPGGRP